mgnify:CR=1 FL=1
MKLQRLAEMTSPSSLEESNKFVGIEAENSMQIVDKFNEVGNNFATSSGDIGEGMRRSAAALAAGGNDINESIGLFTAGQEVLQDAASMGTILKTSSMRLRGASTEEMEQAGLDTDHLADSTSKLREELLQLTGVDIQLDNSTFKSTYQILTEIADVFNSGAMTDVSMANVLEILAGKRNANALAAIIQNIDTAKAAMETARDSNGSAMKEQRIWAESVEGHLGELQSRWQAFSVSLADSSGLKTIIDVAGAAITVLGGLTDTFGSLTMAALPFVGIMSKAGNLGKNMPSYGKNAQAVG